MAIKPTVEPKEEKTINEIAPIGDIQRDMQIVNVDMAVEQWEQYQELCRRLLDDTDYQLYKQNGESKKFPKKSAFFKLGRAFNVDTEIINKTEYRHPKTHRVIDVDYEVRATLPNGRTVVANGSCDKFEKGKNNASAHDLRATAETRATNRAISKLIGAGEVSWEEVKK